MPCVMDLPRRRGNPLRAAASAVRIPLFQGLSGIRTGVLVNFGPKE
jgi:hypothetical protein